jgi:hypothetical protein
MSKIPLALHCCWLIDPWDPRRDSITQAWGDVFDAPVNIWHTGQLGEHVPQGNVVLRHVSELLEAGVIQALGIEPAWRYEHEHRSHAACADLTRYMAVYAHGGVYFDLDVFPGWNIERKLKPSLTEGNTNLVIDRVDALNCEIRLVCAPPRNTDLLRVIEEAVRRHAAFRERGGYAGVGYEVKEIVHRTGPWLMHSVLFPVKAAMPSALLFDRNYMTKMNRHTLSGAVIHHTDFRKTEHVMSSHDRVMAAARQGAAE